LAYSGASISHSAGALHGLFLDHSCRQTALAQMNAAAFQKQDFMRFYGLSR
jgi:hypothetical protein